MAVANKPTAAMVLSIIGGIFYLLIGIILVGLGAVLGSFIGGLGIGVAAIGGIGLVSGIIIIVGAAIMNTSDKSKVRMGSILVLVFTLIGAVFTFGGVVIGFILALIGSVLGLTWNPSVQMGPPPAPPP